MSKKSGRGKTGGATSSVEYSPATLARIERALQRQEERWAAKAGPVTVTYLPGAEPATVPSKPVQKPHRKPARRKKAS